MEQLIMKLTREEEKNIFGGKLTYKLVLIDGELVTNKALARKRIDDYE